MKTYTLFYGLLLNLCLTLTGCANNLSIANNHSGFGGTGINIGVDMARISDEGSSGFGGTGIIGTISDFGSIWVNGIEIDYKEDVKLQSNLNGSDEHLKLGQTVILETEADLNDAQHPTTQSIRIHYALAGKIQRLEKDKLKINNQWVQYTQNTPKDQGLNLQAGQYIAINGHQIDDSTLWQASRLNQNPAGITLNRPHIDIEFSSNVRNVIIDARFSAMQQERWTLQTHRHTPLTAKKILIHQWRPEKQHHHREPLNRTPPPRPKESRREIESLDRIRTLKPEHSEKIRLMKEMHRHQHAEKNIRRERMREKPPLPSKR